MGGRTPVRITLFLCSSLGELPSLSPSLFLLLRGRGEQENGEPHYDGRVVAMLFSTHCEAVGSFRFGGVGSYANFVFVFVFVFSAVWGEEVQGAPTMTNIPVHGRGKVM